MKFIDVLWGSRRREPNPAFQERLSWFTCYPPHQNVQAVPIKCPADFRRKLEKDKRNA